jgi:hypothetical protein
VYAKRIYRVTDKSARLLGSQLVLVSSPFVVKANFILTKRSIAFLSVEGSQVLELNLEGNTVETHELDRLEIHDVAITPDEERMLGVGILKTTKGGLQPSMSRVEKRLVGALPLK